MDEEIPWLPIHPRCPNCNEETDDSESDTFVCLGCGIEWELSGAPIGFRTELYPDDYDKCGKARRVDICQLLLNHRGECLMS